MGGKKKFKNYCLHFLHFTCKKFKKNVPFFSFRSFYRLTTPASIIPLTLLIYENVVIKLVKNNISGLLPVILPEKFQNVLIARKNGDKKPLSCIDHF